MVCLRLLLLGFLSLLLMQPAAATASQWHCKGEKSTGFEWDGADWKVSSIDVDSDEYVIQGTDDDFIKIQKIGELLVVFECKGNRFNAGADVEAVCQNAFKGEFRFNSETLRFQRYYPTGFVAGTGRFRNSPSIDIGSCSKSQE